MHKFQSVSDVVKRLRPVAPVYCFRESAVRAAASRFVSSFPGKILYAVKTNPDDSVLRLLRKSGISSFDVASLAEIKLVRQVFPEADLCFMHPVKSRESIEAAYFTHGVRDFSLDTSDELEKIIAATNGAADLGLHMRLGIPNPHAGLDLSGKFGVAPAEAPELLRLISGYAHRVGVCFHVGSQCMHPSSYGSAIRLVSQISRSAGVLLNVVDIGGGFPSTYPGMEPPELSTYFSTIHKNLRDTGFAEDCEVWCEPGRALVAESASVLVRVELRKGQNLYLNDGTYGSLFDAGYPGFVFPTKLIRPDEEQSTEMSEFSFYGPTCDSLDFMKGPFCLPSDIREGDYIEIGQLGAYSSTLRTRFNGFHEMKTVRVSDSPIESMYGLAPGLQVYQAA